MGVGGGEARKIILVTSFPDPGNGIRDFWPENMYSFINFYDPLINHFGFPVGIVFFPQLVQAILDQSLFGDDFDFPLVNVCTPFHCLIIPSSMFLVNAFNIH